jgi:hypothetical protein
MTLQRVLDLSGTSRASRGQSCWAGDPGQSSIRIVWMPS